MENPGTHRQVPGWLKWWRSWLFLPKLILAPDLARIANTMESNQLLTLTEEAKKRILAAFEQQPEKIALRVEAKTNGTGEFSYAMKLIGPDEKTAEEHKRQEREVNQHNHPHRQQRTFPV